MVPPRVRAAFGNVSSYILHQNFFNTLPCDVLGMSETLPNATGFRLGRVALENTDWVFTPGHPQLQWRPGIEGRFLDAMPGGVGFLIRKRIPHVRTDLVLDEFTDEEKRRAVSITMFPGDGNGPSYLPSVWVRPCQR